MIQDTAASVIDTNCYYLLCTRQQHRTWVPCNENSRL